MSLPFQQQTQSVPFSKIVEVEDAGGRVQRFISSREKIPLIRIFRKGAPILEVNVGERHVAKFPPPLASVKRVWPIGVDLHSTLSVG